MAYILRQHSEPVMRKETVSLPDNGKSTEIEVLSLQALFELHQPLSLVQLGRDWATGYVCGTSQADYIEANWDISFAKVGDNPQLHAYKRTSKKVYEEPIFDTDGSVAYHNEKLIVWDGLEMQFRNNRPTHLKTYGRAILDEPPLRDLEEYARDDSVAVSSYDFRNDKWFRALLAVLPSDVYVKPVLEKLVRLKNV